MDNDIDIYADLPNINLNYQGDRNQKNQSCNCEELKKKLDLLTSELENLQKIKNNLENNLSSLLKTAKAEIVRKDKMIADLRNRLDDVTFRRNRTNASQNFPSHKTSNQQCDVIKEDEIIMQEVPIPAMQEVEFQSHQTEFCQNENKNKKIQNDVDKISTVFGERMHKKIIEIAKEEEKQKASLMLNAGKEIAEESNKENGSRSSLNNDNKSISVTRNSGTDTPYIKNFKKRTIEEDDTCRNKRLKIKDDTSGTSSGEHNYVTQFDLKDSHKMQKIKDNFAKFNDQLNIAHSFKKEQVPLDRVRRTTEDIKQSRNNNEREERGEERNDSRRDYDSSRSRRGSIDNLRNYRSTSTSNRFSEEPSSEYKDDYRYNPSRRHYSKSRSDHESSSSHRLRERSNRTYKDRKYDDYEYNSRYRRGRLKRDYVDKEYDNNKSKYNSREYVDLRDRFKYSSSDIEDSSSYKHKKYKYQGIKESTLNMLENKRPYENDKTINLRTSFTRNMDRNTECKTKNESNIKFAHSSENVATCIAINSSNLEEGEILDSPKKESDASIPKDNRTANNTAKIIEDKIKSNLIRAIVEDQTNLQSNVINTKQKVADIKTSKSEVVSRLPQANPEDNRKVTQAKSSANNATTDEKHNYNKNDDTCTAHFNKASIDGNRDATSQHMRDNDVSEGSCKDGADKKLEGSVTRSPIRMKETNNPSTKEINKIKKLPKSDINSIKSVIEKEKINDHNTESTGIELTKLNHFNDDNKTESEKLENPPIAKPATTKAQTALNAQNNDEMEAQDKNKNRDGTLDETDVEINRLCLSDHNYVRDPVVEDFTKDSDIVQKSSDVTDCKAVVKVASKETKAKKVVNVQSIGTSKKTSAMQKKKIQQAKRAVVSCRRRVVTLSDSNASMIVMMNTDSETSAESHADSNNEDISSKPRLRTTSSRSSSKTTCK